MHNDLFTISQAKTLARKISAQNQKCEEFKQAQLLAYQYHLEEDQKVKKRRHQLLQVQSHNKQQGTQKSFTRKTSRVDDFSGPTTIEQLGQSYALQQKQFQKVQLRAKSIYERLNPVFQSVHKNDEKFRVQHVFANALNRSLEANEKKRQDLKIKFQNLMPEIEKQRCESAVKHREISESQKKDDRVYMNTICDNNSKFVAREA